MQKKNKAKEETEVLEQEVKLEGGNAQVLEPVDKNLELQKEIDKLKEELKISNENLLKSQAELVNYRKRKDEETLNALKYANKDLIVEIISIVDNFERALKQASKNSNSEFSKYLTGFEMMYTNLLSILNKFGVTEINRVGEVFDANLEQAMVAENNPEMDDEIVIEVLQKGYKLKDRVIRPASVKINQK